MAKNRCISSDVLMNDNFISLPNTAKLLYIYFNQETDNLGFVDNLKSIMTIVHARPSDLQLLIDREYIIQVKDWLFLEKHFRLNNKNLRPERGQKSRFMKYFEDYEEDESGMYVRKIDDKLTTKCRQIDDKMPTNCGFLASKVKESKVKENNIIETKEDLIRYTRGMI